MAANRVIGPCATSWLCCSPHPRPTDRAGVISGLRSTTAGPATPARDAAGRDGVRIGVTVDRDPVLGVRPSRRLPNCRWRSRFRRVDGVRRIHPVAVAGPGVIARRVRLLGGDARGVGVVVQVEHALTQCPGHPVRLGHAECVSRICGGSSPITRPCCAGPVRRGSSSAPRSRGGQRRSTVPLQGHEQARGPSPATPRWPPKSL